MSKYIHPATVEAAIEVASNLLPEDRREVEEGHGLDPIKELTSAAQNGSCVWFEVPNGKTAGMAGVGPNGEVWMLCTPAIHEYPITLLEKLNASSKVEKNHYYGTLLIDVILYI